MCSVTKNIAESKTIHLHYIITSDVMKPHAPIQKSSTSGQEYSGQQWLRKATAIGG